MDQELLRNIVGILASFTEAAVTIALTAKSEEVVTSEDAEEIIDNIVVASSPIKHKSISSSANYKVNPSKSAYIRIGSSWSSTEISVSFEGSREDVALPVQSLDMRLKSARTSYNVIYAIWGFAADIFIGLILAASCAIYRPGTFSFNGTSLFLVLAIILAVNGLHNLLKFFLPAIVFDVGKSAKINETKRKVLTYVLTSVVVAFAIGWLVNKFSK